MSAINTKISFGYVSKALHWIMALLITGLFSVGIYMTGLDYYDSLYNTLPWWHKSVGLSLFILLLLRFTWSKINPKPRSLKTHKKWENFLAKMIHQLTYVLILFICISGYFISTAAGKEIEFFTLFEVPAMFPKIKEDNAELIGDAHETMAFILAALVVLHVLAALKHHFIDKDQTLKRMIS